MGMVRCCLKCSALMHVERMSTHPHRTATIMRSMAATTMCML
jgi:hypothetical protein